MSTFKLSEVQSLKLIYRDIVRGYSYLPSISAYIRHLSELDNVTVLEKKLEFFHNYISQGLLEESDQIKIHCNNEEWSQLKEEEISSLTLRIQDNTKILPTIIPQQHEFIQKAINKDKESLASLLEERHRILGLTADKLSEKDSFRYLIYFSLFKNPECSISLFESWDDFELLEEPEIQIYIDLLEQNMERFTEDNIKKISVLPFFINNFSYAKEQIGSFLDKPLVYMTNYQLLLISYGTRNLNILSQSKGSPPELSSQESVQQIINWYDLQFSILLGKANSSK